jgi:hypothetical protein
MNEKPPILPTRTPSPRDGGSTDPNADLAALLRDVLTNVNRQVQATIDLSDAAKRAVENFRLISRDLSVVPVKPAPAPGPTPGPTPAPGPSLTRPAT